MPARILRRIRAAKDAEEIANHIATDSLDAALRFLENTEARLKLLAEFPSSGASFYSDISELHGLRTCRVKGLPNHLVFYFEHSTRLKLSESYMVLGISTRNFPQASLSSWSVACGSPASICAMMCVTSLTEH